MAVSILNEVIDLRKPFSDTEGNVYSFEAAQNLVTWLRLDSGPTDVQTRYTLTTPWAYLYAADNFSKIIYLGRNAYPAASFSGTPRRGPAQAYDTVPRQLLDFSNATSKDSASVTTTTDRAFTFSTWIRDRSETTATSFDVVEKIDSTVGYSYFTIQVLTSTGGRGYDVQLWLKDYPNGEKNQKIRAYYFDHAVFQEWAHICVTYDGTLGVGGGGVTVNPDTGLDKLRLYVNGVDAYEYKESMGVRITRTADSGYVGVMPDNTTPLDIGKHGSYAVYADFAEVAVWNNGYLSEEEVHAVYNATKGQSYGMGSGFSNNPPRTMLKTRDDLPGAYPPVLRTGDPSQRTYAMSSSIGIDRAAVETKLALRVGKPTRMGNNPSVFSDDASMPFSDPYATVKLEFTTLPKDASTIVLSDATGVSKRFEFQRGVKLSPGNIEVDLKQISRVILREKIRRLRKLTLSAKPGSKYRGLLMHKMLKRALAEEAAKIFAETVNAQQPGLKIKASADGAAVTLRQLVPGAPGNTVISGSALERTIVQAEGGIITGSITGLFDGGSSSKLIYPLNVESQYVPLMTSKRSQAYATPNFITTSSANALPTAIEGPGVVRKGVAEALLLPNSPLFITSSIQPYDDSRVYIENDNEFFDTGVDPAILEGFTSPIRDNIIIAIDLNPVQPTEFGSNRAQGTLSKHSTRGHEIHYMVYWNHERKIWEKVGRGTSNASNYTSRGSSIPNTYIDFAGWMDHAMVGFSRGMALTVTGAWANCRPCVNFGFPFHPKFHATSSQAIKMSEYIQHPFVLEKYVYMYSASAGTGISGYPTTATRTRAHVGVPQVDVKANMVSWTTTYDHGNRAKLQTIPAWSWQSSNGYSNWKQVTSGSGFHPTSWFWLAATGSVYYKKFDKHIPVPAMQPLGNVPGAMAANEKTYAELVEADIVPLSAGYDTVGRPYNSAGGWSAGNLEETGWPSLWGAFKDAPDISMDQASGSWSGTMQHRAFINSFFMLRQSKGYRSGKISVRNKVKRTDESLRNAQYRDSRAADADYPDGRPLAWPHHEPGSGIPGYGGVLNPSASVPIRNAIAPGQRIDQDPGDPLGTVLQCDHYLTTSIPRYIKLSRDDSSTAGVYVDSSRDLITYGQWLSYFPATWPPPGVKNHFARRPDMLRAPTYGEATGSFSFVDAGTSFTSRFYGSDWLGGAHLKNPVGVQDITGVLASGLAREVNTEQGTAGIWIDGYLPGNRPALGAPPLLDAKGQVLRPNAQPMPTGSYIMVGDIKRPPAYDIGPQYSIYDTALSSWGGFNTFHPGTRSGLKDDLNDSRSIVKAVPGQAIMDRDGQIMGSPLPKNYLSGTDFDYSATAGTTGASSILQSMGARGMTLYDNPDDGVSPYLLLPEDELILGWQAPMTYRPALASWPVNYNVSTMSSGSAGNTTLSPGAGTLLLYGTLIKDGKESLPSLNQQLTQLSIHEAIGSEAVVDQFDLAQSGHFFGSMFEVTITGSITSREPRLIDGTLNPFALVGMRGVATEYTLGNMADSGSIQRNVKHVDSTERYYDTMTGYPVEYFKVSSPALGTVGRDPGYPDCISTNAAFYTDGPAKAANAVKGAQAIILGTPGTDPSGWQGGRLVSPPCGPDNIDLRWLFAFPFEGDYSGVSRQATLEKSPEMAYVNPGTSAQAGFVNEAAGEARATFEPENESLGPSTYRLYTSPQPLDWDRWSTIGGTTHAANVNNGMFEELDFNGNILDRQRSRQVIQPTARDKSILIRGGIRSRPDVGIDGLITDGLGNAFGGAQIGLLASGSRVAGTDDPNLQKFFFGIGTGPSGSSRVYALGGPKDIGSHCVGATFGSMTGQGANDWVDSKAFIGWPEIRGWKYGLRSAIPERSAATFRRDRYGQFRDMLEQREYTRFYNQFNEFRETGRRRGLDSSPVFVNFVDANTQDLTEPANTHSQNLSRFSTSSLPYFDGEARNRTDNPDSNQDFIVDIEAGVGNSLVVDQGLGVEIL